MTGNAQVIEGLNGLLADGTIFYQKLRHYHWNVVGREFFVLHEKFEELYSGWADLIDDVAERILMIEGVPLHTLASMLKATHLEEDEGVPPAPGMVEAIVADLEALHVRAGEVLDLAESAGDRGTADLLDDLRNGIEKETWMLGAWKKEAAKART